MTKIPLFFDRWLSWSTFENYALINIVWWLNASKISCWYDKIDIIVRLWVSSEYVDFHAKMSVLWKVNPLRLAMNLQRMAWSCQMGVRSSHDCFQSAFSLGQAWRRDGATWTHPEMNNMHHNITTCCCWLWACDLCRGTTSQYHNSQPVVESCEIVKIA